MATVGLGLVVKRLVRLLAAVVVLLVAVLAATMSPAVAAGEGDMPAPVGHWPLDTDRGGRTPDVAGGSGDASVSGVTVASIRPR